MNIDLSSEPVALANALLGLFQALLAVLIVFGVELTDEQIAALMAFVAALVVMVNAYLVRNRVTPVSNPHDNTGRPLIVKDNPE